MQIHLSEKKSVQWLHQGKGRERERWVTRENEEYFGDVGNVLCPGCGFGFMGVYNYQNKTKRIKITPTKNPYRIVYFN